MAAKPFFRESDRLSRGTPWQSLPALLLTPYAMNLNSWAKRVSRNPVSAHLALQTSDGTSQVSIADPTGSLIVAPLLEIGPTQAVIETTEDYEPNAYLDLTLELKGQPPRKFFAHVVGREEKGVRIRWMHLDPGEEQKLKGLLAAYARTSTSQGHGTRRVIKPQSETFMPFGGPISEVQPPAAPPEPRATRRVIKPGARAATPEPAPGPLADEHLPSTIQPGEESKSSPVVIAATDKFEKLRHIEDAVPVGSMPTGAPDVEPDIGSSGRTRSINKDGRMDVGAAIRSKAKTVRASELAARHDKVRVLNMATIKSLIQDAVEEAAAHLTRALGDAERKRLLEEAEEGFKERLKAFEIDKKSAEEKARLLQTELNAATTLLDQERKRSIAADQFTVSEAGLAEIDVRMQKIIERSVSHGEAGPELELKLRDMIAGILDSEREKMRDKELSAHNDKIALLEKKVARLAHSLDSTEKERDDARQLAEAMEKHGISAAEVKNKYRIGLDGEDPNRERKLALMRELVEQNRELRKALGIATRDPAEVAREVAEETQRRKEEAHKAKLEALGLDEPAAKPVETPLPVEAAEAEPTAEAEPEAVASTGDEPAAPEIDPDDQPWEAPAAPPAKAPELDERGIKSLRDYKRIEPPPLQIIDQPGETDEVLVDPDDQPWDASARAPGT
jgi:hypothetical protein